MHTTQDMAHGTNYSIFNKAHVVTNLNFTQNVHSENRSVYCCISASRCAVTPQHTFRNAYVHDLMITEHRVETEPKACTYFIQPEYGLHTTLVAV